MSKQSFGMLPFGKVFSGITDKLTAQSMWRSAVLASLGLHSLLLLVPTQANNVQKTEPRKIDEKAVKITQLSRPKPQQQAKRAEIKPKPKATPVKRKPKVAARRTTPPPPVLQIKSDPKKKKTGPDPQNPEEEKKQAQKQDPSNNQTLVDNKKGTPADLPQNNNADQQDDGVDDVTRAFAEPLGSLYKEVDAPGGTGALTKEYYWKQEIPPAPEDFQDPTPFYENIDEQKGRPGVITFIYLSPIRDNADIFYANMLEPTYTGTGFAITKTGDYGGGPVYEVSKGADKRYFSVVPAGGRAAGSGEFQQSGLMVVIWKESPV